MRPLGIAALCLVAGVVLGAPAVAEDPAFIGSTAPPFDLPTLDGGRVELAGFRGQTVVLHFGAGW